MWEYMVANKGSNVFDYGGNKVYVNAGRVGKPLEGDAAREKGVRKIARLLIEQNGGDGPSVKKRIDTKYPTGVVCWKGEDGLWKKVAEWKTAEGKVRLMSDAAAFQAQFDKLMGIE